MKSLIKMVAVLCLAFGTIATNAGLLTLQLNGFNSYDELDGQNNIILTISLNSQTGMPDGSPIIIDGIGWDLNIETFGQSWLSEASIKIGDDLFLTPGLGVDQPGNQLFSSGGVISLSDLGIENITLTQGTMHLQFFETFDDAALELDAIFRGTLTFSTVEAQVVPVPAAVWLFFSALASAGLMRRRQS